MVGPDVLANNDIAEEFTNDNNNWFDVNEFIDLNQSPDLDMALKCQTKQA